MSINESSVTILGCGTCQLEKQTAASSVLLNLGSVRIVYDMGRSVPLRIAELGYKQDDIQHIVISHFHADHISDLVPYLQAAAWSQRDPRSKDLTIYGPAGIHDIINGFYDVYGKDQLVQSEAFEVYVKELPTGTNQIADLSFEFAHLPPANNHGMKFAFEGRIVAITGDSHFHDKEIEFLKDVDIAVIDSGHLSDEEIVELAAKSSPKIIYCSHLYRDLDLQELQSKAEQLGFTGELRLPHDLERIL